GLRDRIKDQVDPDLMTNFLKWAKWLNQDEVTEAVIRQVISPSSQVKGNVYTDYGGQVGGTVWNGLARAGGTLGVAMGSLAYFPAMDMVRQALPMVMSFLKMAMVICIPMVLVIGTYQLKVAMTMTVVFFAMMFVDFWFQLARYIDSTILDAFYGSGSPHLSFNPVMGLNTATQDAILNFVMGAMFVILPMLWITAIGWAGVQVGALLSDLSNGVKGVQQAGAQGGGVAKQAISSFSPKGD
ncbi:conjugal transfer protein TraG N-terminal domain-containing protein, partial [Pseudomonas aeruginosa]|nr:conjugal transfer protein TraG N-terminal domain-containing protein [Pseudomonas aeruginosa]MDG4309559.1 conjugal transfer protein TraG N-terminal domain-containing protein [Pseudomonas aeruginosa]MDK3035177.1 conjugal transfer protein TraG N-terminal domain-containing protein [Pseudomonas aeruginosa]HCF3074259.1 conjugal transfer protein TraG N-terminal domain-containing protein [Pseudomonas aeruginosa]HCF5781360.1 conjugal transfer protein TraG N-terminal domain-containing protein [Pseudom